MSSNTFRKLRTLASSIPGVPAPDHTAFTRIAYGVLQDNKAIEDRLRSTPHFGVLDATISRRRNFRVLSRYNYVTRICSLAKESKKSHLRIASRRTHFTLKDKRLTGLDIINLWAIFSSYSHRFGTFASSRAIAYDFSTTRRIQRQRNLEHCSTRLATQATIRDILQENKLLRVHHAFGLAELALLDEDLASLYSIYLQDEEDVAELRRTFRRIRQVAYSQIQKEYLGLITPNFGDPVAYIVGASRRRSDGVESAARDAIDRYNREQYFGSPTAAHAVLCHLRQYREWSKRHTKFQAIQIVQALGSRPPDWPHDRKHGIEECLFRVDLPVYKRDWVWTVEQLNEVATWDNSSFFVHERDQTTASVPVQVFGNSLGPKELTAIFSHCEQSIKSVNTRAPLHIDSLASIDDFACAILGSSFCSNVELVRTKSLGSYVPRVVLGRHLSDVIDIYRERVRRTFGTKENSKHVTGVDKKIVELDVGFNTLENIKDTVLAEHATCGHWLCCTETVELIGTNGSTIADLDFVAMHICGEHIYCFCIEEKSGKGSGHAQLTKVSNQLSMGEAIGDVVRLPKWKKKRSWVLRWRVPIKEIDFRRFYRAGSYIF